jgi:SAM-dependent methyltransferase
VIPPSSIEQLRDRGFEAAVRRFLAELRRWRLYAPPDREIHPFDRMHGVDTSGLLYADKLTTGHAHDAASEGYYATAPSLFHGALARWQATLAASTGRGWTLEDYSLIDLGCGKGRVLLLASEYRFRKVTGVELSPKLAKVARRNLATWLGTPRACRNVTVMVGDVMQLRLPEGPAVLFLFNSFGAPVMTELLEGLVAAARIRSGPIDLIYVHPDLDGMVRQAPGFELLADGEIPFTPEDSAADAFEVASDRCTIYRLRQRDQGPGTRDQKTL